VNVVDGRIEEHTIDVRQNFPCAASGKEVRFLHVRRLGTRKIEHSLPIVMPISLRFLDRIVRGMLINLDREKYCVDDSEFDDLEEEYASDSMG